MKTQLSVYRIWSLSCQVIQPLPYKVLEWFCLYLKLGKVMYIQCKAKLPFKAFLWQTWRKRSSHTTWQVLKGQTRVVLKPHKTEQLRAVHTPLLLLYLYLLAQSVDRLWRFNLVFIHCSQNVCVWPRQKCHMTKMTSSISIIIMRKQRSCCQHSGLK